MQWLVIVAVIGFLVLSPTLMASPEGAHYISGSGTIMGTASLTVHFSPAGGSFTGSFSQSNATGECPSTMQGTIEGTFEGGDGGAVYANMNGLRASEKCSIHAQANGSFTGKLYANGSGNGTAIVEIAGGESGEVPWQVTFSPEEFISANIQTYDEDTVVPHMAPDESGDRTYDDNEVSITKIYGDVGFSNPLTNRGPIIYGITAIANGMADLFTMSGKHTPTEEEIWGVPEEGMKMTDGFQMKTGDGRAVVQFKDGTKFIIKENSTIRFNKNYIELTSGSTIAVYHKLGNIIYKYGTSQYRPDGTQFELSADGNESSLKVYDGAVEVTKTDNAGKKIMVNAGEELMSTDSGLGDKTALTGVTGIDFDKIDNEIWDSEISKARITGLTILGGLIVGLAAVIVAVVFFLRKRKSKAATVQAPGGPVHTPLAPDDPFSTPPAPVRDAATTTEAPDRSNKYCTNCGSAVKDGNRFCGDCGAGID